MFPTVPVCSRTFLAHPSSAGHGESYTWNILELVFGPRRVFLHPLLPRADFRLRLQKFGANLRHHHNLYAVILLSLTSGSSG